MLAAYSAVGAMLDQMVFGVGVKQAHDNAFAPVQTVLPKYVSGEKTIGAFNAKGFDTVFLRSGENGWSVFLRGEHVRGFNGVQMTYVEGHAAALMRILRIRDAFLEINNVPCSKGPGGGCEGLLRLMLPEGASLTVRGPDGYRQTFVGEGTK
jgi:hypothetical protein